MQLDPRGYVPDAERRRSSCAGPRRIARLGARACASLLWAGVFLVTATASGFSSKQNLDRIGPVAIAVRARASPRRGVPGLGVAASARIGFAFRRAPPGRAARGRQISPSSRSKFTPLRRAWPVAPVDRRRGVRGARRAIRFDVALLAGVDVVRRLARRVDLDGDALEQRCRSRIASWSRRDLRGALPRGSASCLDRRLPPPVRARGLVAGLAAHPRGRSPVRLGVGHGPRRRRDGARRLRRAPRVLRVDERAVRQVRLGDQRAPRSALGGWVFPVLDEIDGGADSLLGRDCCAARR